jgi:PAS domain S-box-containing protein
MRRSGYIVNGTIAVSIVVLLAGALATYQALRQFSTANNALSAAQGSQLALEQVLSLLRDAETGQRGFLLTQRSAYLEPYNAALAAVDIQLGLLGSTFAGQPDKERALAQLSVLVARKRAELAQTISVAQTRSFGAATEIVLTDVGKATMDAIRDVVGTMQTAEQREIDEQLRRTATAQTAARNAVALAAALSLLILGVLVYVTRRGTALLRASEQELAITLHSIGDAVIATDAAGRVRMMNSVAEKLTGWQAAAVRGWPIDEVFQIVDEHTRAKVESPVGKVLREGSIVELVNDTMLVGQDGTETAIEDSAAPILDDQRHIRGVVLVFRDATISRAAERALRDADRRKDEFLAVLAHELRNPLAPIRQAARIVSSGAASPTQLRWSTEVVERQVGHMARLLDDLLDVSRITRGTLEIRRSRVTVAQVLDVAVEMARPLLDQRRHAFAMHVPAETLWLDADPLRVAQVVGNLLNNAAKFTPAGGRIELHVARDDSSATIRVVDSGVGLARDSLAKIFDMFVQVGSPLERTEGGLGIGLALAKGLVELHGGTIAAHSAGTGHGTELTVRLPLASAAAQEPQPARNPRVSEAPPASGLQVLVADDNLDAAESLSQLLRLAGHDVTTVHDGGAAWERIESSRPAIALLDIGMPQLNGYEVAARVRASPWSDETTLIALTGWGQASDRARALTAGFDEHWVKPIAPEIAIEYCGAVARRGSLNPAAAPRAD